MPERGPYAKGIAKREEILDAALEVFARTGYDRTSVREIARMIGMSQAGLLHHFSTKEELFLELLRRRDDKGGGTDPATAQHTHSVDKLIAAVDRNAREPGLVRLFVSMSAEITRDGGLRQFFEERYRWLRSEIAADVRRHQERGEMSRNLDADAVASILVATADGLQIQWLLDPESVDMGRRLKELWKALCQAS